MTNIKMTLLGLLVVMTFLVAPVIGGEHYNDDDNNPMGGQEGHIRGSELMDKNVHDQQGNELGSINDLVISRDGEIEFLVVSEGDGFLGLGENELTPIPFDQVDLDIYTKEDDAITVQIDEQRFRDAPSFNDDQWETFTGGEMDQEVRGYYEQNGVQYDRQEDTREEGLDPPPMERP